MRATTFRQILAGVAATRRWPRRAAVADDGRAVGTVHHLSAIAADGASNVEVGELLTWMVHAVSRDLSLMR